VNHDEGWELAVPHRSQQLERGLEYHSRPKGQQKHLPRRHHVWLVAWRVSRRPSHRQGKPKLRLGREELKKLK